MFFPMEGIAKSNFQQNVFYDVGGRTFLTLGQCFGFCCLGIKFENALVIGGGTDPKTGGCRQEIRD